MRSKKTTLPFLVVLLLAINVFLYWAVFADEVHVVTVTENGFVPSELNITRGDTVTFVSDRDVPFWPASDSHPSHGIFPEFDPRQPIQSNDSWSFTFEKLGSWGFHDHVSSQFKGSVTVYSEFGESSSGCIDRDFTGLQEECWMEEFKLAYEHGGFDMIFTIFEDYQKNDEVFANNCHDIMHLIGDFAYEEYAQLGEVFDQPETAYCSFGFYHGFIERMITETGDHTLSREYCERLGREGEYSSAELALDAEYACVHGFGHAIFDSLDGGLWGNDELMVDESLGFCEDLFTGDAMVQECGTGVWNALAIAYTNSYYDLTFERGEMPYDICQRTSDLYKSGCYVELVMQYSHWNGNQKEEDFQVMRHVVEPVAQERTYEAFVSDAVQWRLPWDTVAIAEYADRCFEIDKTNLVDWCQKGVHHGVLKRTSPYVNVAESMKICAEYIEPNQREICENNIPDKLN